MEQSKRGNGTAADVLQRAVVLGVLRNGSAFSRLSHLKLGKALI